MPSDRGCLYIALYARGGSAKMPGEEDKYHWALLVGPNDESRSTQGVRYHVKEVITGPGKREWKFEERQTTMTPTNMVLVRVMIGKVADPGGLAETLRAGSVVNDDKSWNCVTWVKDTLAAIATKKIMGECQLDWKTVRDVCMNYCQRKHEQGRFDGSGNFDKTKIPTFDLLKKTEKVA